MARTRVRPPSANGHDIDRLGELLRLGYTAIVIQIGGEGESPTNRR